jgi:hypothetical protein
MPSKFGCGSMTLNMTWTKGKPRSDFSPNQKFLHFSGFDEWNVKEKLMDKLVCMYILMGINWTTKMCFVQSLC